MKLVRALVVLLAALAVQAAIVRFWPAAHRYVDLTFLPVVWYGISRSQRSAMLVGCAAGLLQDAWFQVAVFGLNGFKKTLLGWALGGLGSRFDLKGAIGHLLGGALFALGDSALDFGLRRLLDLNSMVPPVSEILIRAVVTGLLVAWSFTLIERLRRSRAMRRWV